MTSQDRGRGGSGKDREEDRGHPLFEKGKMMGVPEIPENPGKSIQSIQGHALFKEIVADSG